ncbi:hypothetical protein ACS0ZG_35640 [Burkholderia gladioli]
MDEQRDQVLSALRKRLSLVLHAEFDEAGSMVYLMAYECGVASGLYGADSAICLGMRRGVEDAMHVSPGYLARNLLSKAEELGQRHGELMRSMMGERIQPLAKEANHSPFGSRSLCSNRRTQEQ